MLNVTPPDEIVQALAARFPDFHKLSQLLDGACRGILHQLMEDGLADICPEYAIVIQADRGALSVAVLVDDVPIISRRVDIQ